MDSSIKILPASLANMIAAGQVVGRPANVVKELVENAIDAGASSVKVGISDGGRTLIQVIDNGKGMNRSDAQICFEHHSTSKISAPEDLSNILTFGFRGEALASIAAVAKVSLKTRAQGEELGTQVTIEDSQIGSVSEISCPQGCNFEVRDLFYNIPARRKFLKTDAVELKHIIAEFIRIALSRIDVSFTLQVDGKDAYVLRKAATLKLRIEDIFSTRANELMEISADSSVAQISGFTGIPSAAKKTAANQYFFVNGRYFRSPYLYKAVLKAYENLIPEGYAPSYFIFLQIDPAKIDVNVDPEKTEIKFEDDSIIFNVLYGAIRQAVGMGAIGEDLNFDQEFQMPTIDSEFRKSDPAQPTIGANPFYNPFGGGYQSGYPSSANAGGYANGNPGTNPTAEPQSGITQPSAGFDYNWERPTEQGKALEQRNIFAGAREKFDVLFSQSIKGEAINLEGKYIVSTFNGKLIIVNVRRAYEKIYYERYYEALSKNLISREALIFPIEVELNPIEEAALVANISLLQQAGFEIEVEGRTAYISATPGGISSDERQVRDILDGVITLLDSEQTDLNAHIIAALAQKYAVSAAALKSSTDNMSFTGETAQLLINNLMATSEPAYTLSGKKTFHVFEQSEIDKLF